jgi:MoaA/NifB/PqqE/SkfB family radical SAM enzyme
MSDLALPYVIPIVADPALEQLKYENFLAALSNRRRRAIQVDSLPFDLTIDLTSACQLQCPYCSTGNGTISRQRAIMKDERYDSLMRNVGDHCFIVWYFSNGEPLLHKRFGQLIATTKQQQIFSVISTNLSLPLSEAFLTSLVTSGLGMISVSMDGATSETYRQYRRGGDFDLVVENIQRLIALKNRLGLIYPLIEWRFLRFQHNEHEEDAARALAVSLGVDLLEFWDGVAPPEGSPHADGVFRSTLPLHGPPVSGPALAALAVQQVRSRALARLVPVITVGGHGDINTFSRKCDWLYFSGMLHPNGRVGPCCVSNNEEHDFVDSIDRFATYGELFNSPNYIASRTLFTSGVKAGTICQKCPNREAQHYQFRMKLRAILRNAPDHVVERLAASPDDFFLPEDRLLVPEVDAVHGLHAEAGGTIGGASDAA